MLRNRLTREFEQLEKAGASIEELENLGAGKLRDAVIDGNVDSGSVMAGQIAGMVRKVQPAYKIIEELVSQTISTIDRLNSTKNI